MLPRVLVFCFGLMTLGTGVACALLLFTGKPKRERFRPLFDFSAGREEGRRMQALLRDALAASTTDDEFRRAFKRGLAASTGRETELGWMMFQQSLFEYRSAGELDVPDRTVAERFLKDIPRRYHLRDTDGQEDTGRGEEPPTPRIHHG